MCTVIYRIALLVPFCFSTNFLCFFFFHFTVASSSIYQCGGSGMFIPDPGSWFLPILDPGSRIQKQQWKTLVKKNLLSYLFFGVINFTKLNYFIFEMLKKKIWANFLSIIELFTQKIVSNLSKIWVWDPGPGKNLIRIPDPGSRGQKGTGSRIRIRNTGIYGTVQYRSGTIHSCVYFIPVVFVTDIPQLNTHVTQLWTHASVNISRTHFLPFPATSQSS